MTPAEIAALRALYERIKGYRGFTIEESDLLRAVPALLSALEEARAQVADCLQFIDAALADRDAYESALEEARAEIKRWEDKEVRRAVDCCGQEERALAAESRADALQRERDEMEKSKWYERDRRKEAESRADALQAESDALHQKFDAEHQRANALQAEVAEARKEYRLLKEGSLVDAVLGAELVRQRDEARARADALQAEVERTRMELRNVEEILNVERAEATEVLTSTRNSLLVELNATAARADAAWRAALEAAAKRAEAEEELDGQMPEAVRLMAQQDPCGMLRGAVRATKKGIAAGIRALPPPSATAAPCGCRESTPADRLHPAFYPCPEHTARATAAPAEEDPARCRLQGGDGDSCAACNNIGAHSPAREEKCPEGCKGIGLGDGNHSGCSCGTGKLANGDPRPAGFKCDCPHHPPPKCPDCVGTGVGLRCDTCGEIMGDGPRCERCENVQTNCRACGGSGLAPSRGEVG